MRIKTTVICLLFVLGWTVPALASAWSPYYIDNLEEFIGYGGASYTSYSAADISGTYDLTALGFESAGYSRFTTGGSTLFSTEFVLFEGRDYDMGATEYGVDLTNAAFGTGIGSLWSSHDIGDTDYVRIYQLTSSWTAVLNGNTVTLAAGTLILGYNDSDLLGLRDFDDLIIAAAPTATPIPGAAWLLGTGVLGLFGLRRKLRN